MKEHEKKPKTQSAGAMPPPRPPTRTAVGLGPDGEDDDSNEKRRKKETVRINLPPKVSAAPTIKLPTLPPGGPAAPKPVVLSAKPQIPALVMKPLKRPNPVYSAALVLILQAVLVFEACASADKTTFILFLVVALVLSVPGYLWAFEKTRLIKDYKSLCC